MKTVGLSGGWVPDGGAVIGPSRLLLRVEEAQVAQAAVRDDLPHPAALVPRDTPRYADSLRRLGLRAAAGGAACLQESQKFD